MQLISAPPHFILMSMSDFVFFPVLICLLFPIKSAVKAPLPAPGVIKALITLFPKTSMSDWSIFWPILLHQPNLLKWIYVDIHLQSITPSVLNSSNNTNASCLQKSLQVISKYLIAYYYFNARIYHKWMGHTSPQVFYNFTDAELLTMSPKL